MKLSSKASLIVMFISGIFLFIKYIAQLFPSLITTSLMQRYALNGLQLGILASSYYYSYSVMQIFSGFFLDKFSMRIAAAFATGILALGLILFVMDQSFYLLCFSRVLMGVGASFATVMYMKNAATCTTSKTFGLVSSLLATATMLGAAVGGAPLACLFHALNWKISLLLIAAISVLLMMMSALVMPGKQISSNSPITNEKPHVLKDVLFKKQNWLLLFYSGMAFSPVIIMGGLWGIPFLKLKYHLSTQIISILLSIMFLGLAIGAPVWSYFSAKYECRKKMMQCANVLAFISLIVVIYFPVNYQISAILFFSIGFNVGCFMLSFQICRDINPIALLGLSFALMNSGEGLVSSFIEPAIGWILDIMKPTYHAGFSISEFHIALIFLPLCFIIAACLLYFIETENRVARSHYV